MQKLKQNVTQQCPQYISFAYVGYRIPKLNKNKNYRYKYINDFQEY